MEFLPETIKNMERDVGLTFDQMKSMDMGDIENHIHKKLGHKPGHNPRLYRRCRDVLASQGRFYTEEEHERNVNLLVRKYLPLTYYSDKIKSFARKYFTR